MITAKQDDLIQELAGRYKSRISAYEIHRWLMQFNEEDYDYALEVLLKIKFYEIEDIYNQFEYHLPDVIERISRYYKYLSDRIENELAEKNKKRLSPALVRIRKDLKNKNKIFVTGIGNYGKSGSAMMYFFTHTQYFRDNQSKFILIDNTNNLNLKTAIDLRENQQVINSKSLILQIVLVDDVTGSGQSFVKYYNNELKPQMDSLGVEFCIHLVCLVSLREGIEYIKKSISSKIYIYSEIVEKSLNYRSNIFGYRHNRKLIRDFCLKYGKGLYVSGYPDNKDNPLGHGDSQMLAVFPHSTPNNTLPIIWSNKRNWYPLFPRSVKFRIENSKDFREELGVWTSIANRLGFHQYLVNTSNRYEIENLQMLCLIKLLVERKSLTYILSCLGLLESELFDLIETAQSKGLVNEKLMATDYSKSVYSEIKQSIRREKSKKSDSMKEVPLYLPQRFRGYS